jgi:hypothetical protein
VDALIISPEQSLTISCSGGSLSLFSEDSGSPRVARNSSLALERCNVGAFPEAGAPAARSAGALLNVEDAIGSQLFGNIPGAQFTLSNTVVEHSPLVRSPPGEFLAAGPHTLLLVGRLHPAKYRCIGSMYIGRFRTHHYACP